MYSTLKVRLKIKQEEKEKLFLYEKKFHKQLEQLVNQMLHTGDSKFSHLYFEEEVDVNSRWLLYHQALKKFYAIKNKKRFQYERSSSWHPKSFQYHDSKITLKFGTAFMISDCTLPLSLSEFEIKKLEHNNISRLDIVHDEKYWYANFILK